MPAKDDFRCLRCKDKLAYCTCDGQMPGHIVDAMVKRRDADHKNVKQSELEFESLSNALGESLKRKGIPHCCPVCGGNGLKPAEFYLYTSLVNGATAGTLVVDCRACDATGIVWAHFA